MIENPLENPISCQRCGNENIQIEKVQVLYGNDDYNSVQGFEFQSNRTINLLPIRKLSNRCRDLGNVRIFFSCEHCGGPETEVFVWDIAFHKGMTYLEKVVLP